MPKKYSENGLKADIKHLMKNVDKIQGDISENTFEIRKNRDHIGKIYIEVERTGQEVKDHITNYKENRKADKEHAAEIKEVNIEHKKEKQRLVDFIPEIISLMMGAVALIVSLTS